ncbi:tellurite resistance TerB family protein [Tenacibaculum finnmarkense]|uniref:hypothetical protein n=1 Tax=Tenacibaculum finnmarkense TaxID=2781243 RepID=UPI001E4528D1|nr:hypothetical protein [Tenacibaculum finnmarkense]MCD8402678.1 hypothetical protein [Tenacibaculum finnmarkense genomovar finnmarkense]
MELLSILKVVKKAVDLSIEKITLKYIGEVKELRRDTKGGGLGFDRDGDMDFNVAFEYSNIYSSIIGHIAHVDNDEIQGDEMDAASKIINNNIFSEDGILRNNIIMTSDLSKKKIRKDVYGKIETPYSLKKIAKYAINREKEEIFYQVAYTIATADRAVSKNEIGFLKDFAKQLKLSKFDIKNIEKQLAK